MQELNNLKEYDMSIEAQQANSLIELQLLQNKIAYLEDQLKQTIIHSKKKEAYTNTLESDLEHIIVQLKRLEVVR